MQEYLMSASLKDVPFNKISSMLFAAIARKAASGQKRPPNRGMCNDIDCISTLLPYCDAMFIDNECHGYLQESPLRECITYGTKTFGWNNRKEFLAYLSGILSSGSKEHLRLIEEVYGPGWSQPYTTLYQD